MHNTDYSLAQTLSPWTWTPSPSVITYGHFRTEKIPYLVLWRILQDRLPSARFWKVFCISVFCWLFRKNIHVMRIHLRKWLPVVLIGCENLKYKTGFPLRNVKVLLEVRDTANCGRQISLYWHYEHCQIPWQMLRTARCTITTSQALTDHY